MDLARRFVTLWLIPLTICVLFGLSGCSLMPVSPGPVRPDPSLLQPCLDPEGDAATNSALLSWFLAYRDALRQCNNQITTFKGA